MRIRLQGPGFAAGLLSELNRCRQSHRFCDVLLQVGTCSFSAHRAVLACAGTYFCNLFSQTSSSPSTAFSLEFISPTNFEKVLTFVYTGELVIDLIDVGVLFELAERLGIGELVRACHTTFPDLQTSAKCKGRQSLNSIVPTIDAGGGICDVIAPSACSSAASCSSLSSGLSAAPTPKSSSPLFQTRRRNSESQNVKSENIQSDASYGQSVSDQCTHTRSESCNENIGTGFQLKTEFEEEEGAKTNDQVLPERGTPVQPDSPTNAPQQPEGGAAEDMQMVSVQVGEEVGDEDVTKDTLVIESVQGGHGGHKGQGGQGGHGGHGEGSLEVTDEEQWRQLGEIIELSDDENYLEEREEEEEEEDDDDLMCIENGDGPNSSTQAALLTCRGCGVSLPSDPGVVRAHAESHLNAGQCGVCGIPVNDHDAGIGHALSHMGVQMFSCHMCHSQYLSLNKLLRHQRTASSSYTIPHSSLSSSQAPLHQLTCAVCSRTLNKDFKSVRDHALSHLSSETLTCGVCSLPQTSLCALLWHTLSHLSLPVFTCPHCAQCFVQRPLLDRHMTTHAAEAKEKELSLIKSFSVRPNGATAGTDELHCFLCPHTFRSTSAFHAHLSVHTSEALSVSSGVGISGLLGKRKTDQNFPTASSSSSLRDVGGLKIDKSVHGFQSGDRKSVV